MINRQRLRSPGGCLAYGTPATLLVFDLLILLRSDAEASQPRRRSQLRLMAGLAPGVILRFAGGSGFGRLHLEELQQPILLTP
jgi:hypothetical protein